LDPPPAAGHVQHDVLSGAEGHVFLTLLLQVTADFPAKTCLLQVLQTKQEVESEQTIHSGKWTTTSDVTTGCLFLSKPKPNPKSITGCQTSRNLVTKSKQPGSFLVDLSSIHHTLSARYEK
jgi:hypothetical protein